MIFCKWCEMPQLMFGPRKIRGHLFFDGLLSVAGKGKIDLPGHSALGVRAESAISCDLNRVTGRSGKRITFGQAVVDAVVIHMGDAPGDGAVDTDISLDRAGLALVKMAQGGRGRTRYGALQCGLLCQIDFKLGGS